MSKQARLLAPVLLFISLLLSACMASACDFEEPAIVSGDQAAIVDKSLLTGEPCAPPCWHNITPGITSATEAVEILKGLEFVNPDSISQEKSNLGGGAIAWRTVFAEDKNDIVGILFDQNGIVYRIRIYELWYFVTLRELIDAIGEPDGIMTRRIMRPDGWSDCMTVSIVWFDKGLEVTIASAPLSEETLSLVKPNIAIRRVTYFPSVSDLEGYVAIQDDPYLPQDTFIEWQGFE